MFQKALVGSAIRYIAGRNAVQTVYWRSTDAANSKMVKVSKTVHFRSIPPQEVRHARFN